MLECSESKDEESRRSQNCCVVWYKPTTAHTRPALANGTYTDTARPVVSRNYIYLLGGPDTAELKAGINWYYSLAGPRPVLTNVISTDTAGPEAGSK